MKFGFISNGRRRLRAVWGVVAAGAALGLPASQAQVSTASAAGAAAPLYVSCGYVQGDIAYFSGIFTVGAQEMGQVTRAFRDYAQAQAGGPVVRATCRPARDQAAASALQQREKQMVGTRAGLPARSADIQWRYTPNQAASAQALPNRNAPTATRVQYASTPANGGQQAGNAPSASYTAQPAYNSQQTGGSRQVSNNQQQGAGNQSGSGVGSGVAASFQQTGQSMRDTAVNTGTGMANSVGQIAADTSVQMQKAASERITGWLSRKNKPAGNSATNASSTTAPGSASPMSTVPGTTASSTVMPGTLAPATTAVMVQSGSVAPMGSSQLLSENTVPATPAGNGAAMPSAARRPAADGPTFVVCHVSAGGTEYFSDVFPTMEPDDQKMRFGFWQQVSQLNKGSNVPYKGVVCSRATSEGEAEALRTGQTRTAAEQGVAATRMVNTGWSYVGH